MKRINTSRCNRATRKNPRCADDQQIAALLADWTLCLHLLARFKSITEVVARFIPSLDRLGDDPKRILVLHQYVIALQWSGLYREAERGANQTVDGSRRISRHEIEGLRARQRLLHKSCRTLFNRDFRSAEP